MGKTPKDSTSSAVSSNPYIPASNRHTVCFHLCAVQPFSGPELKGFKIFDLQTHGITFMFHFVIPGVMGEYEPKIEVQFPEVVPVAKSSTVKLACFALGKYVPLCVIIPQ